MPVTTTAPSAVPTGTAPVAAPIPAPAPGPMEGSTEQKREEKPEEKTISDGAGPAVAPPKPKPVEVMSVPQTPLNGNTPAGGTPRPELDLSGETQPEKPQAVEAVMTTSVLDPQSTPKASASKPEPVSEEPIVDRPTGTNGVGDSKPAEMMGALQTGKIAETVESAPGKRKAEDSLPTNGSSPAAGDQKADDERADKKLKTADTNGATAPRKVGRPKKDKKAIPVIGKALRKTRSQGPAEA